MSCRTIPALLLQHNMKALHDSLQHNMKALHDSLQHNMTALHDSLQHNMKALHDSLQHNMTALHDSLQHNMTALHDSLQHNMTALHDSLQHNMKALHDSLQHNMKALHDSLQHNMTALHDSLQHNMTALHDSLQHNMKALHDSLQHNMTALHDSLPLIAKIKATDCKHIYERKKLNDIPTFLISHHFLTVNGRTDLIMHQKFKGTTILRNKSILSCSMDFTLLFVWLLSQKHCEHQMLNMEAAGKARPTNADTTLHVVNRTAFVHVSCNTGPPAVWATTFFISLSPVKTDNAPSHGSRLLATPGAKQTCSFNTNLVHLSNYFNAACSEK
ncbi:uncharacterized protein LOC143287028 [Babylonia areolata]|uniref:uncharacterized protein LOC143287028 n=1 Tax=Babylonia areolata TaxID=304850 RepID=UPI003FD634C6